MRCVPLPGIFALLVGCPLEGKEDTAPWPTVDSAPGSADTGGADPTETDVVRPDSGCADSGIGQLLLAGDFTTRAGEFVAANLGWGLYGLGTEDWACLVQGELHEEGAGPGGCPDCDWSFDLSPITHAAAHGAYCDQFFDPADVEDTLEYSWGFATTYTYDSGGSYSTELSNVLLFYYDRSWYPLVWGDAVHGDAESFEFTWTNRNYGYYYYYCR